MERTGRNSSIRGALALAALVALVAVALVSPVGAALNKSKVKNIAAKAVNQLTYTEAEADGRFINTGEKASDSELLDGVDSAGFVQPQGSTHITVGPYDWVVGVFNFGGPPVSAAYFTNEARFSLTSPGSIDNQVFGLNPDLPTAVNGRSLQLQGVEFCYDSTSPDVTLDTVFLSVVLNSASGSSGTTAAEATDTTDRNDAACRLYTLPTPFTLTGEHFVTLEPVVDYADTGDFIIGRTTFVLTNTNSTAASVAREG